MRKGNYLKKRKILPSTRVKFKGYMGAARCNAHGQKPLTQLDVLKASAVAQGLCLQAGGEATIARGGANARKAMETKKKPGELGEKGHRSKNIQTGGQTVRENRQKEKGFTTSKMGYQIGRKPGNPQSHQKQQQGRKNWGAWSVNRILEHVYWWGRGNGGKRVTK